MPKIVTPKPKVYTDEELLVTPHGQQFKAEDLPEQFTRGQCKTLREWMDENRVGGKAAGKAANKAAG